MDQRRSARPSRNLTGGQSVLVGCRESPAQPGHPRPGAIDEVALGDSDTEVPPGGQDQNPKPYLEGDDDLQL